MFREQLLVVVCWISCISFCCCEVPIKKLFQIFLGIHRSWWFNNFLEQVIILTKLFHIWLCIQTVSKLQTLETNIVRGCRVRENSHWYCNMKNKTMNIMFNMQYCGLKLLAVQWQLRTSSATIEHIVSVCRAIFLTLSLLAIRMLFNTLVHIQQSTS